MILNPPIQLLSQRIGDRHRFPRGGNRVPDVFHQLDAFSHAQGQNILHGNRTHTSKFVISRLPIQLKFRSSNCQEKERILEL